MSGGDVPAARWEGRSAAELAACWRAPAVHLYTRAGSTNDLARALADAGAPHGAVVLADSQTAGRGRGGRSWSSAAGLGLLFSLVLRPRGAAGAELLPLLIGLGVARAVDRFVGDGIAQVKWPNDVLVGGRKLAGVLCEGYWQGSGGGYVVAGVGVNALHAPADFPRELDGGATSIAVEAAAPPARVELMAALLAEIRALLAEPAPRLPAAALAELERRDALRGRLVEATAAGAPSIGTALGIAADGALLLRDAAGVLRRVRTGSVRRAVQESRP